MIPGIKGPGQNSNDYELKVPDCVKLITQKDSDEFQQLIVDIISAANENAVAALTLLIGDQEPELIKLFKAKLNVK